MAVLTQPRLGHLGLINFLTPWNFSIEVYPDRVMGASVCCRETFIARESEYGWSHMCGMCATPIFQASLELDRLAPVREEQAYFEHVIGLLTDLGPLELTLAAAELSLAISEARNEFARLR